MLDDAPAEGFSFDALPADLFPLFLERLAFPHLLNLRLCCRRLNTMSLALTRLTLTRPEQLFIPLLRRFADVQFLTLKGYQPSWVPRFACVLTVFPKLVRLCLTKDRHQSLAPQMLTDGPMLALIGALQAGACPHLYNLNLDERLSEEMALQVASAMLPDGGLLFATIQAHEGVVLKMLDRGAFLEASLEEGETPLIVAAYHACPAITKTLLEHKALVNSRRNDGATPLIMAANRGNTETVEVLLAACAEVNAAMHDGVTALQRAADKGHAHVVAALLRGKAQVPPRPSTGAAWGSSPSRPRAPHPAPPVHA